MGIQQWIRGQLLDWAMRQVNELRPGTLADAQGEVLEVGFGTGLNLGFYPAGVKRVVGIEPNRVVGLPAVEERIRAARFPVEQHELRADRPLPFDAARFDCVVATWTLCSIQDPAGALREMRRVLKPGGIYLFIEHGRAPDERLAGWQDRLNPVWRRLAGGCNMNRSIDTLLAQGGFEIRRLERFRHPGPALLSQMYRGSAQGAA